MIGLILAGAPSPGLAMGFIGLPREVAAFIGDLHLSPFWWLMLLMAFFIVVSCCLGGTGRVARAMAALRPTVQAARIKPPVGCNRFVRQGLTGRERPGPMQP